MRDRALVAGLLLSVLATRPAHAQAAAPSGSPATDQAAAEALFLEGRRDIDAGDHAMACPKLAESQRLDPASGTLLNLADCYEKNGQLASAWVTFREATTAAERDGRTTWAKQAAARARLLEPRLPTVTIEVDAALAPEGLLVLREGAPMARSTWGSPIPVDPSVQRIEAHAPGMKAWTVSVRVDAEHAHVIARVPKLEPLTPSRQAPRPVPEEVRRSLQKPIALTLLGVAAVSLGVGSVFGAMAISNNSEAARRCPASPACSDPTAVSLTKTAKGDATASTISFAGGGLLLAVGGALFFSAPAKGPASGLQPAVTLNRGALGVALQGSF